MVSTSVSPLGKGRQFLQRSCEHLAKEFCCRIEFLQSRNDRDTARTELLTEETKKAIEIHFVRIELGGPEAGYVDGQKMEMSGVEVVQLLRRKNVFFCHGTQFSSGRLVHL
jgi:hypothetical protein